MLEKYCDSEQLNAAQTGNVIDLENVLDAKPGGVKFKLEYTSIGLNNTAVWISSAKTASNFFDGLYYKIGIIDILRASCLNHLAN